MFNTLKYAKQLELVGVIREQAEVHIQILSEVMENNLATQQNLHDIEQRLTHEIVQLEQRMTIKLGTIVSIAIGVAVTIVKLVS